MWQMRPGIIPNRAALDAASGVSRQAMIAGAKPIFVNVTQTIQSVATGPIQVQQS